MKIYRALIGKRERECGHEHRTEKAARKCGDKIVGRHNDEQIKITWTVK
jgi:hypothetical protein